MQVNLEYLVAYYMVGLTVMSWFCYEYEKTMMGFLRPNPMVVAMGTLVWPITLIGVILMKMQKDIKQDK